MVVTREYVDIGTMRTFVAAPAAEGSYPGVVFYTDIFQLTEASLRWAVRLAGYGFVVAAPEIYHRVEPPGTVLEFDDEGKARGQADVEALTTAQFDEDIAAALAWLGERCSAVGAAGHCTGGHLAFRAAFDERREGGTVVLVRDRPAQRQARRGQDRLAGARGRDRRRDPPDLGHPRPPHAAGRSRRRAGRARRDARSRGASTTPSTPSAATSATASTPRRPIWRSPRPSRSSGGRCDPVRPPGVVELHEGADPAAAARAAVRDRDRGSVHGRDKQPEHIARNPDGRVPVLELDSGEQIPESGAILLHLAEGTPYLPPPGLARTRVYQWMMFEQNQVEAERGGRAVHGADGSRANAPGGVRRPPRPRPVAVSTVARGLMDGRPFIAGDDYTVADIALYAYVHCADEAGVELLDHPSILSWIERVEATPRLRQRPGAVPCRLVDGQRLQQIRPQRRARTPRSCGGCRAAPAHRRRPDSSANRRRTASG